MAQRDELLADLIGIGPEGKGAGVLAQPLGLIMRYCETNELPPLTVLVVTKETGQPGKGLRTIQELHTDREKVFAKRWLRMKPPEASDFARHQ